MKSLIKSQANIKAEKESLVSELQTQKIEETCLAINPSVAEYLDFESAPLQALATGFIYFPNFSLFSYILNKTKEDFSPETRP